jgi:hypothetical protein
LRAIVGSERMAVLFTIEQCLGSKLLVFIVAHRRDSEVIRSWIEH